MATSSRETSSALWGARDAARSGGGDHGSSTEPPRDVASMKAEITDVQSKTTASLDRSIAAAQASLGVGNHIAEDLQEQREQMGQIDRDARNIEADLKRTSYNLKHGFTWVGALSSPFRRASKVPSGAQRGKGGDISPVFKDGYQAKDTSSGKSTATKTGAQHGTEAAGGEKQRGSLFARKKGSSEAATAAARAANGNGADRSKLPCPEHAPKGFEDQLDELDGLLDGLAAQAGAIGAELRQQNEGIETLGSRVEPIVAETSSQAKQIKRRFGVKGL